MTAAAIEQLRVLFGARSGAGIELAARATRTIIDPEELTLTLITLRPATSSARCNRTEALQGLSMSMARLTIHCLTS